MLSKLNVAARRILEETEDISGKKFRFVRVDKLDTFAKVKAARKSMKEHIIFYKDAHDDIINHIVAHECGHIIRIFKASENERLVPSSNESHINRAKSQLADDLARFTQMLGPEKANELFLIWFHGIISQLTNQPVDIMIEKWIFRDHPDLRELQLASFRKQQAQAVFNLKAEARSSAPLLLYDASNLMYYAYLRQLGLCVGENFLKPYNSSPYIDKGKALSVLLVGVKEDTMAGDVLKINRWAEFLGLEGWFDWIDYERIPVGYEDAV